MQVQIQNFQSIASADLTCNGLTVIVGRSNVGKSALLRAIRAALFNASGEGVVRDGATEAIVTLIDVPAVTGAPLHSVQWVKGKAANRFVLNGVVYDRVGSGTPLLLQEAGYRELSIGKGSLCPQTSTQFDPIFLLSPQAYSGAFIHDVLSAASRLSILMTATGLAARDGKRERTELGIRQADLTAADRVAQVFAPVPDLRVRVTRLLTQAEQLFHEQARHDYTKQVAAARRPLVALVRTTLPHAAVLDPMAMRYPTLCQIVARRQTLQHLGGLTIPPATDTVTILTEGQRLAEVRRLSARRVLLRSVKAWSVMPAVDLTALQAAAASRAAIASLLSVRRLIAGRLAAAQRAVETARQTAEALMATASRLLKEAGICPVCQQPIP